MISACPPVLACAALALCAAAPPPGTDLAAPGSKTVRTELVFELTDAVSDRRFAVSPGGGSPREINADEPVWLRWRQNVSLHLLSAEEEVPERSDWRPPLTEEWAVGRPQADLPVRRASPVLASSPVARVRHTIRILAIDGDELRFEVVGTSRFDANGEPVDELLIRIVLAAAAAVGATGLVVLARRRRRNATVEATEARP